MNTKNINTVLNDLTDDLDREIGVETELVTLTPNMLTLESFLASVIRQHRKKFGIATGYYYLTPKQTNLYTNLFRARVLQIEKLKIWNDGKFVMQKDGLSVATLYRYGKKLSWAKMTTVKSMAMMAKRNGKLAQQWINCEGGSIVSFNS